MKVITIRIDKELLRKVDEYALLHVKTRSEVIRKAIREFLDNNKCIKTKRLEVC